MKSRLQTLATTLDSRGWAVKNLTVAPALLEQEAQSDRLVAPTTISAVDSGIDIHPADDIMDELNNPTAQYFAGLMEQADADRKVSVANKVNTARIAGETYVEPPTQTDIKSDDSPVTAYGRADKLELAQSGNDFSVATLSKLANRKGQFKQIGPNEVVLTLH